MTVFVITVIVIFPGIVRLTMDFRYNDFLEMNALTVSIDDKIRFFDKQYSNP